VADRTEEFPRSTSNPSELTRAARSANGCRRGKKEGKKKGEKRKGDGGGGKMPEGRMARQPDGAGERAAGLREEETSRREKRTGSRGGWETAIFAKRR